MSTFTPQLQQILSDVVRLLTCSEQTAYVLMPLWLEATLTFNAYFIVIHKFNNVLTLLKHMSINGSLSLTVAFPSLTNFVKAVSTFCFS